MNREQIFRELYKNNLKREEYFDSIPRDICMVVVDNGYTDNLLHERDKLIECIFAEWTDAITWFLYDWQPGFEAGVDGHMTKINNIDEYIDYMKKTEGFE